MKRNISLVLVFVLFCCTIFSLTSCNKRTEKEYVTRTKTVSYIHFNTVSILSSYGDTSQEEFDAYVKIADETLEYYHKLFDIYYEYEGINNLKTVNDNAGKEPVQVGRELVEFLLCCKQLFTETNGKTNVMLGSVLKIWHEKRELAESNGGYLDEALLPSEEELASAASHTSIDLLIIDEEANTVYISDPLASIDVGAIAKGYAADKLASRLKELGADSLAINAGGNIITIGTKGDGNAWVSGITNPDKSSESSLACRVEMGEGSLVTSGNYERFFVSGDRRYHHVIDPETLMPADYFASVSVFASDSALSDALSTALFCMSYEQGLELLSYAEDVDAMWIYNDGTIRYTDGVRLAD